MAPAMSIGAPAAVLANPAPETPEHRRARRQRSWPKPWRLTIFVLAGLCFLVPLACSFKFSLIDLQGNYSLTNYTQIISSSALRGALILSLEISAITALLVVGLILPTAVLVRLRLPKWKIVMEVITILPIVVPPITLAAGLSSMQADSPLWLVKLMFNHPLTCLVPIYTVIAMPLVYRSIDNGLRAIDLQTLVDASRSLGSGSFGTLFRVILPNVQTAVIGGMLLSVAMVLGEVVISGQMSYNTFPNEMILVSQSNTAPGIPVAETLVSTVFTVGLFFVFLTLAARKRASTSNR
jgi:putative spermidine/putrescine transport system permease protein